MISLAGGDFLGWFKFEDVYKFSRNIVSSVYCFAVVKKVPNKNNLPCEMIETVYIGESGGQDKTWDQKDKNTSRGRVETSLHKRMKYHSHETLKNVTLPSDKHFIVVGIFVPKNSDTISFDQCKIWQKASESELIYYYGLKFGKAPQLNLAHRSKSVATKNDKKSISQEKMKMIKDNSLERFYE